MTARIRAKIYERHGVLRGEVEECFGSKRRASLKDPRAEHATIPPTEWFIATTKAGRKLKDVYIYFSDSDTFLLKTAYEPDDNEDRLYDKESK